VPDLGSLRSLGERVQPPPLGQLEDVARRRARLTAAVVSAAGVAAVVVAAVLVLLVPRDDGAVPEPVRTPTATPSPTASATDEPGGPATHASDTSMTLREVVAKPNADLVLSGVSADNPDFRVAIWSAPCSWCPNDDEPRGRPRFWAMAVTTDGFETATYRRIPYNPFRDPEFTDVESLGPGLLLLVDTGNLNRPGWLVRDDATLTRLTAVVATRSGPARRWHQCGGYDADPYAHAAPVGWCLVDPRTDTSYQAEAPWLVDELVHGRPAVSPAEADEPWGLENVADLVPYWYDGGVLHTRDLGPADAVGTVSGVPRGQMAVWSLDRQTLVLTIRSSADRGRSWQASTLDVPSAPERLGVHRTSSGAFLLLRDGSNGGIFAWPPREIWRVPPGAETVDVVYAESERTDVAGYDSQPFDELDGRIWSGGLWSDDDGRTWHAITTWR
jgi:hypothetical protein